MCIENTPNRLANSVPSGRCPIKLRTALQYEPLSIGRPIRDTIRLSSRSSRICLLVYFPATPLLHIKLLRIHLHT